MVLLKHIALAIFVFTAFLSIATIYKRSIKKTKNLINYEIRMMFYWVIIFVGLLCSIIPLGIQPTTLLAVFGTTGLALALALQGVLTNMVSGIYISVNELFQIDDMVSIVDPSGNRYTGTISKFSLFNTVILDSDKHEITIPNTYIQNNIIKKL